MSITLNLKPELEADLIERAKASGMSLEEYVTAILGPSTIPEDRNGLTGEQRAAAFEKWADGHRRDTPLLSDYAVSRASMYNDSNE